MKRMILNDKPSTWYNNLQKVVLLFMVFLALGLSVTINANARGGGHGGGHGWEHGGGHSVGHGGSHFGGHVMFGHARGYGHIGHAGYYARSFELNRRMPYGHYSFLPHWRYFLPYTSLRFFYGGFNFYLCNSIYYQYCDGRYVEVPAPGGYQPEGQPDDRKYEELPPVGAVLESIPEGAEKVVIDNQTYYISNGVQYKPVMRNNEVWYQVIKSRRNAPVISSPSQKDQNTSDGIKN